ncbi:Pyoverdine/dityrosine biosynthesis protein-domain-containing protein [Halenospora varia]|nr:Pyoverdine/dityrosine biosynthesis protein-domain-containing protein [Halenospora varia]
MEISNVGASIYHEIKATYARTERGQLLRIFGPKAEELQLSWDTIWNQLSADTRERGAEALLDCIAVSINATNYVVWEGYREQDGSLVGIIQEVIPDSQEQYFRHFFLTLLRRKMNIHSTQFRKHIYNKPNTQVQTQSTVNLFDKLLRHIGANDQWELGGRDYFASRVEHFTSRGLPCEFCLPAFPCKSSNQDKVMGIVPDKGEEMGLLKLHNFVRGIEEIYPPGAKVWIISEVHVFSDCSESPYTLIAKDQNSNNGVGFQSLVDLFDLKNASIPSSDVTGQLNIPGINHYLETALEEKAELCRRILMSGCQSDSSALRSRIDSRDPDILALYQGFSSQRKKLSIRASFEMIMAYSNLVELVFPNHVRLSIHAHSNSGPKFGIQLFERGLCKPASALLQAPGSDDSNDLLHIPTLWHNCIIQVADDSRIYVGKSKIIKDALARGLYIGGWKEEHEGMAGRFELARCEEGGSSREQAQELDVESLRYRVGAFVVVCVIRLLMSEENQRRFVQYL